jgi:Zn-dependent peptidase ImmA (M78 family)/transcriptional regulator with XRE-family HTH domain
VNRKFQGQRLRFARMYNGLSVTDLANQAGLSKQVVSQYENDETSPSHEKVVVLSETLGFPYEFFMTEDLYNPNAQTTYFRSLLSAKRLDRTAQSKKLEIVSEVYSALNEDVDFRSLDLPRIIIDDAPAVPNGEMPEITSDEIEGYAQQARSHWMVPDGPMGNLQYLLEKNGLIVTGFDTEAEKIDAFSERILVDGMGLYIIAVDQGNQPEGRIRFDLSHELGHILMHPWSENLEEISKEEFKKREDQANDFASAFLLPKSSFTADVSIYPTDLQYYLHLKKKWHVSVAAMLVRARRLGVLTPNQYQYLMRQYSKNGWRGKEPDDTPFALNDNIFQKAIDALYKAEYYTPVSMMRYFESRGIYLYPTQLEKLLNLRPGTLKSHDPSPMNVIRLRVRDQGADDEASSNP